MDLNVFNIDKFNVIQDEENYYVFRALNNGDHNDIVNNITSNENGISRIRTDRERYEEINESAKYNGDSNISLEEVWDHIKMRYSKETNCISLSSNANVSIDYGQTYNEEYVMVKVPKTKDSNVYNAGQYMLEEIEKEINKALSTIPQDSGIIDIINQIDKENQPGNIKAIVADSYDGIKKSSGRFFGKDNKLAQKQSIIKRFDKKQYFNEEQQLEYNKIIAKLTVLEASGRLRSILPTQRDNSSLIATVGMAFSSGELIHYKDIDENELAEVPKEMMDILSLIQQIRDKEGNNAEIRNVENKIIEYINNGYKFEKDNEKLVLTNGKNSINLNNISSKKEKKDAITVEDVYNLTSGKISYEKAKIAINLAKRISQSKIRASEYGEIIRNLTNASDELIDRIKNETYTIDKDIISRENNEGLKIDESVNIGLSREERHFISNQEQLEIIDRIKALNEEQLKELVETDGSSIEKDLLKELQEGRAEIPENMYFAEVIVNGIDFNKIYKTVQGSREKTEEEHQTLMKYFENVDCKKIYNSFIKAGVNPSEISGFITNLLFDNGYKGYSLEELSKLDNLDEIISSNILKLNNNIQPLRFDKLLGIFDDSYIVPETEIKLRDYQYNTDKKIKDIFKDKRFAGMILPTGGGKSFVAMSEMMDFKNSNILFIAPQETILSQFENHILKNILHKKVITNMEIEKLQKEGKEIPSDRVRRKDVKKVIKEAFPHLEMFCYATLADKDDEWLETKDADIIILDELHRAGAKTWKPQIKKLIEFNPNAKILGMTATPIRDMDHKDMTKELAALLGEYTEEEFIQKKYLASEMYLLDAMQDGIVVSPKIVTFDYTLKDSAEYKEVEKMIREEKNLEKKSELVRIYKEMTEIIGDSEKDGMNEIFEQNIKKKNGKYIVFLPNNNTELSTEEYIKKEIDKVKGYLKGVNSNIEASYLLSDREGGKSENIKALEEFENSDSDAMKLIFAIDMLNEGVHVDGIDGEIMLRPISENTKILYSQQIGRCIFSVDPNNPIADEDRPIIFDVYNNYLAQNMDREANKTNSTSDLQRLQALANWIENHKGYIPDINSENINEARKAITMKNIQKKYEKYIYGIKNKNLSESEIFEIKEILELGKELELWDLEIPDRIIPPGERDISRNNIFKVTGTQRDFVDLFKQAKEITSDKELSPNIRIKEILPILDILSEYGVEINNETINYTSTLDDVLREFPNDIKKTIYEELEVSKYFNLGKEYNFAKLAFMNGNRMFDEYSIGQLRKYGIFEEYLEPEYDDYERTPIVDENGFIEYGSYKFQRFNIRTESYYDEQELDYERRNKEGYNLQGLDKNNFDKEGYWYTETEDGMLEKTEKKYDAHTGRDKNGTRREWILANGFDKTGGTFIGGYYHKVNKEGDDLENTGRLYNDEGFNAQGLNKSRFDKDGYWYEVQQNGKLKKTDRKYNQSGYDINKVKTHKKDKITGEFVPISRFETMGMEKVNGLGFDEDGFYYKKQEDGTFVSTGLKYNEQGFKGDSKHVITGRFEDLRGFTIYGKCYWNVNRRYDKNGFKQDGTYKETGELYHEGYNAFGLDETGKDRTGKIPPEIVFVREYITEGVTKGKGKEILEKYDIKTRSTLNFKLYKATEMCPQIKKILYEQIAKYQLMIKQREEKLKQLESQKTEDKEQIEKLKKENAILRNRISLMNPMNDLDK